MGNWTLLPVTSLMSLIHSPWEPMSLALYTFVRKAFNSLFMPHTSPIILTPRFSNSSFNFANAPSSVVQTGVKSAGWEKRIAQLSPIHWWKSISPWVVSALKLGADSR
jgi:hypothetical protein